GGRHEQAAWTFRVSCRTSRRRRFDASEPGGCSERARQSGGAGSAGSTSVLGRHGLVAVALELVGGDEGEVGRERRVDKAAAAGGRLLASGRVGVWRGRAGRGAVGGGSEFHSVGGGLLDHRPYHGSPVLGR